MCRGQLGLWRKKTTPHVHLAVEDKVHGTDEITLGGGDWGAEGTGRRDPHNPEH